MNKSKFATITVLSVLLLAVFTGPVFAQPPNVITAEIDRTTLSTDESLILTVTVNATTGISSQPMLPALDGFNVLGSSSATQISLVNGEMSIHEVYRYQLQPTRIGNLVIPPITVSLNGQPYSTAPATIQVTQSTGQVQPAPSPLQPGFPSLPGFPSSPTNPSNPARPVDPAAPPVQLAGEDYFVEAEVDNTTPYQGEQVIYTFRFYQATDLFDSLQQPEYQGPGFTGFWHELQPERGEYHIQVGGRTYRVTQLQTILFPTVVGQAAIDPATLTIPDGFFSRGQVLRADPISLDVRPLPANPPAGFQGAMGQFNIEAAVDTPATKVNDTVTLKVTLNGQGNINTLPDPDWPDVPEWRAFESQANTDSRFENGKLTGTRVYSRVMVPTTAGDLALPPIQYSYFDPTTGTYQTISTQPISVTVAPDANAVAPTFPAVDNDAVSTVPGMMDIRPPKPAATSWSLGGSALTERAGYWLLWAVPLLLIGGQYAWQQRQRRLHNNVAARRSQKAARRAKQALKGARKDPAQAHNAAGQILTDYIAAKLNRSVAGLTHTTLSQLLLKEGVDPVLVERVQTCLMLSEMGHYAPQSLNTESSDMLAETKQLIEELEKVF